MRAEFFLLLPFFICLFAVTSQSSDQTDKTSAVQPRRYDITNLGEPMFFRGWVDVQGKGAANDYCR